MSATDISVTHHLQDVGYCFFSINSMCAYTEITASTLVKDQISMSIHSVNVKPHNQTGYYYSQAILCQKSPDSFNDTINMSLYQTTYLLQLQRYGFCGYWLSGAEHSFSDSASQNTASLHHWCRIQPYCITSSEQSITNSQVHYQIIGTSIPH